MRCTVTSPRRSSAIRLQRGAPAGEDFCKINVFDGPELATHVDPVPEENRKALKYVFTYQQGETPPVVVREAQPEEGKEPRESPAYRFLGNPRSTWLSAGSGQREVTTFALV